MTPRSRRTFIAEAAATTALIAAWPLAASAQGTTHEGGVFTTPPIDILERDRMVRAAARIFSSYGRNVSSSEVRYEVTGPDNDKTLYLSHPEKTTDFLGREIPKMVLIVSPGSIDPETSRAWGNRGIKLEINEPNRKTRYDLKESVALYYQGRGPHIGETFAHVSDEQATLDTVVTKTIGIRPLVRARSISDFANGGDVLYVSIGMQDRMRADEPRFIPLPGGYTFRPIDTPPTIGIYDKTYGVDSLQWLKYEPHASRISQHSLLAITHFTRTVKNSGLLNEPTAPLPTPTRGNFLFPLPK